MGRRRIGGGTAVGHLPSGDGDASVGLQDRGRGWPCLVSFSWTELRWAREDPAGTSQGQRAGARAAGNAAGSFLPRPVTSLRARATRLPSCAIYSLLLPIRVYKVTGYMPMQGRHERDGKVASVHEQGRHGARGKEDGGRGTGARSTEHGSTGAREHGSTEHGARSTEHGARSMRRGARGREHGARSTDHEAWGMGYAAAHSSCCLGACPPGCRYL